MLLVGLAAETPRVFLTRRSPLTHHGNTWALPGGARDRDEAPVAAGLREFTEEIGALPEHRIVGAEAVTEGGWTYHYVLAETETLWHPPRQLSWEITAARWVPVERVAEMRLHPGFAKAWPALADGIRARHATGSP